MKVEVAKLDINKLVNSTTDLNNLKTKIENLDVKKLKTVPIDLKKINNEVSKEVEKKAAHIKLNTNVSKFYMKIPDVPISNQSN